MNVKGIAFWCVLATTSVSVFSIDYVGFTSDNGTASGTHNEFAGEPEHFWGWKHKQSHLSNATNLAKVRVMMQKEAEWHV